MTDNMMRLRELARGIAPEESISDDDAGFTIEFSEAPLFFFSAGGHSAAAYCRACVARLGSLPLPPSFAEEALKGNFFWRGTDGATLSYEKDENAIYLTDRFDDGAFADEAAFADYAAGIVATLADWRARLSVCLPETSDGKEA